MQKQFKESLVKKQFLVVLSLFAVLLASPAFAQYSVNFGTSSDNGHTGDADLNTWFTTNGYAINAATDYIGHGAADSDPFLFNAGATTFEVVSRLAGNAAFESFGFYTGAGAGKTLTEVLGNGANGPTVGNPGSPWGVYMNAPTSYHSPNSLNWFSDRSENLANQTGGSTTNKGGDPQALIYKLTDNQYLLAWEDLDYTNFQPGQSDRDFNDAYLKVTVTPEPASMLLFGLGAGLLGLAGIRGKRTL
jgi:hypothetical protein